KTDADAYIKQLNDLGFNEVMLSLGAYPVIHILPQLNIYNDDVRFDGHLIKRNQQQEWTSYSYHKDNRSQFPVKAESETLAEEVVLSYAAAFQLLLHDRL